MNAIRDLERALDRLERDSQGEPEVRECLERGRRAVVAVGRLADAGSDMLRLAHAGRWPSRSLELDRCLRDMHDAVEGLSRNNA